MDYQRAPAPEPHSIDSIDLDALTDAIHAPIWLPEGDTILVGGSSWTSSNGVEQVYLVTRSGSDRIRRIEIHTRAVTYQALQFMASDLCEDNRVDSGILTPPRFPDDLHVLELLVDSQPTQCLELGWGEARIVSVSVRGVRTYICSLMSDAPVRSLYQGTGVHGFARQRPG